MEVHWEPNERFLYSPKPREWTYFDWFRQIINAAAEQSCVLHITPETSWNRIDTDLRSQIENWMAARTRKS